MFGQDTACSIGAPISANRMYAMTPKGVFKTSKYRNWIETNLPIVQSQMRPARNFPIDVDIIIVQGRDWGPNCDPDNACKPILDLLSRAGITPDDSGKYIRKVNVRYMPLTSKGEALTRIQYEEPELEVELFDVK
jgi:Holliday junction resolvase RusA-like endonuclease